MLALAEAVEIGLGRVALQSAEHHKVRNRGIAQPQATPQGLVHCLLVVHLTVAHWRLALAVALAVSAALLHKLLGGDELQSGIDDILARDGLRVGMIAQQLQLGGKRSDGCLHAVAFREPAACCFHQYVKYLLQLSGTQSAILGAVVVQLLEALLHSLGGTDVEQGLAVLALRRAGMNLKFYSVCLARHNLSEFCLQSY